MASVLFIWFNFDTPAGFSHGLASISRELKEAGHKVDLLHLNEAMGTPYSPARIRARLHALRPDVVGLSFGTNHAWAARETAALARKVLPGATIVCGGIHATVEPQDVMQWPGVDAVAVGEADDGRFLAFVEAVAAQRVPVGIPGIRYRDSAGVVRGSPAPPVAMSAAPRPIDLELFDHRRLLRLKLGYAESLTGRGCAFDCSYCQNPVLRRLARVAGPGSPRVRRRTVADVLDELREYRRRFGARIRVFAFNDDLFVTDRRWFRAFAQAYRAEFDVPLVFNSAAGAIDAEVARLCAEAGTYMVRIGVESGSDRVRGEVLRRPERRDRIVSAVRLLHAAGVNVLTYNMLAIPTETMRDVQATFRFNASLRTAAVRFSMFCPYPCTQAHELCVRKGLIDARAAARGNYFATTPLRWRAAQARFYARIPSLYAAALNRYLHVRTQHGAAFASLLRDLASMPDRAWSQGGQARLRQREASLEERLVAAGKPVYRTPFGGRPDTVMLVGEPRSRGLINV
jgi:anaerobic magnesium-protoporphyrin IX monomethyl ester cyclase